MLPKVAFGTGESKSCQTGEIILVVTDGFVQADDIFQLLSE